MNQTNTLEEKAMIEVRNVTMQYRMSNDRVSNLKEYVIKRLQKKLSFEIFTALEDVSFSVKRGEVLGLIGHNGAGKSTILKVISGIVKPTKGSVHIRGNVVPMLELGSGFDFDMTGRENIFLNGAILGYSEEFLKARYDDIVEFAEIGQFIEMPLRNYSSGMIARLGFSIATVVEPEILIVDEVLAVGDAAFQEKSKKRMMELMSGGTTVLFVSHNLSHIRELCDHVVWLEHGKVKMFGDTQTVCDEYKSYKYGAAGEETVTTGELNTYEFKDVSKNEYYYDAVIWAVGKRITTGTGDGTSFEPNAICTRGQAVTFLWRAAGKPEPISTTNPFKDVTTSDYFYKALLWAMENGITTGTGDGSTFEPNTNCTRAQIVTFLSRAKEGQATSRNNPFVDVEENSYYYNPVLWAVENKITTGTGDGTTFEPEAFCTRGQVITFLWRSYAE